MNKLIPSISIIFPVFNGLSDTIRFLNSTKKINYSGKIEIILVDNASTDNTTSKIARLFPRVKIISNKTNLGFAKAINIGAKKAMGDLLFITNNDVVLEKSTLSILVNALLKSEDYGVVGGKVLSFNKKNISFCGARFNFWLGTLHKLNNPKIITETHWVTGCCLLIKKSLFNKLKGFDEGFFFSFEDFDLCIRLKKLGFKIIYEPKSVIYHSESSTIDRFGADKKLEELYKAKYRFVFKNLKTYHVISILLFQLALILPYRRIFMRKPYFRITPLIRGLWWNLENLNETMIARRRKLNR